MDRTKQSMKMRGTWRAGLMDRMHRRIYRLTGGRVGGRMSDDEGDSPILLLTTTGRLTGKKRTHPLLYIADDTRYVVVASNAGADNDPAWFLNIQDDKCVEVQVGKDRSPATARIAASDERDALWPRLLKMYSGYDAYQADTDRVLPVVILEPHAGGPAAG